MKSIYAKIPIHFCSTSLKIEYFITNQKCDIIDYKYNVEKSTIEADKDSLHEKKAKKIFNGLAMGLRWILDGRGCSA